MQFEEHRSWQEPENVSCLLGEVRGFYKDEEGGNNMAQMKEKEKRNSWPAGPG